VGKGGAGGLLTASRDAAGARTTLTLDKPGEWQLVVMDEAGQTAAANFTLQ
jgi:penicillin-binding protein 1C